MKFERLMSLSLAACLGSGVVAQAQTTQPAAGPQVIAPTPAAAQIDPKAAELISQVKTAYGKLTALDVAGKFSGNFDVAGQKQQNTQEFSGSFAAPNQFRHQSKEGLLVGSTGEKIYVYSPGENAYVTTDAANKERFAQVPQPAGDMLFGENPSLLMAISQDPMQLFAGATVTRGADVTVDTKAYPALHVTGRPSLEELTLLVDPSTHLLRRVTTDLTKPIAQRGAPDIKAAEFVVDYTSTTTGEAADAAAKPEQFAWAPPEGARDAAAVAAERSAGVGDAAAALEGKPAPAFALKNLADQEVTLAGLKGQVVVLDFWATWCPPCIAALPGLDKFAAEQGEDGAKIFAVNVAEEKDKVQAFITGKNLTLPVLLDTEGKISEAYQAQNIPQTVIIGKDGNVRKVLVGMGHDDAIRTEVAEALKQ